MTTVLLLMAMIGVRTPVCSDGLTQRLAQEAQFVVEARVVEVGPALGIWSGGYIVRERVDYEITEVLKGTPPQNRISVAHEVVRRSPSADTKTPRLSPALFAKGNRLLLILKQDPEANFVIYPEAGARPKSEMLIDLDADCGVFSVKGPGFSRIRELIRGSKQPHEP